MQSWERVQHLSWFLLFWLTLFGIGIIGAFLEFRHSLLTLVPKEEVIESLPVNTLTLPETFMATVSAREVWLYERNTGTVLYSLNADEATAVASLAKLMTALVAREEYASDESVLIASGAGVLGNKAGFFARDTFRTDDLIQAMLIFSANDAAWSLAAAHPNSTPGFVMAMNQMAQRLGLKNTSFQNSYGWDHPEQYSTAADIGRVADQVLQDSWLADVVAKTIVTIREQRTGRADTLYTTNTLLRAAPEYRGMKTGTTELAGQSLVVRYVASAPAQLTEFPGELDLILVILGSQDRYADAKITLQAALKQLEWLPIQQ